MKEDLFRNFGCLMNGRTQLVVQHRWKRRTTRNAKFRENSYKIEFVLMHSNGRIAFRNESNLSDLWSTTNKVYRRNQDSDIVSFHFEPSVQQPLRVGIWRLLLISRDFRENPNRFDFFETKPTNRNRLKKNSKGSKKVRKSRAANDFSSAIDLNEILNDLHCEEAQSRLLAERRFLIVEPSQSENCLEDQLKQFWTIKDVCVHEDRVPFDACGSTIKSCLATTWSSSLPDPKSEFR